MRRVAFVMALVTGIAAYFVADHGYRRAIDEAVGGQSVKILVAASDLTPGSEISASTVALREIPERFLDSRYVRAEDLGKVVGDLLSSPVQATQALLWSDFSQVGVDHQLATIVRAGQRAVTIEVADVLVRAGLLRPGNRIDIFATETVLGRFSTTPLLQNVVVLAVGSRFLGQDDAASDDQYGAITVGVSTADARLLVQASSSGRLDVALRNHRDSLVLDKNLSITTRSVDSDRDGAKPATFTKVGVENVAD